MAWWGWLILGMPVGVIVWYVVVFAIVIHDHATCGTEPSRKFHVGQRVQWLKSTTAGTVSRYQGRFVDVRWNGNDFDSPGYSESDLQLMDE